MNKIRLPTSLREPLARLDDFLTRAEEARRCIAENRRPIEKDQARSGYESCVLDELAPVLYGVVAAIIDGIECPRDHERFARAIRNAVEITE